MKDYLRKLFNSDSLRSRLLAIGLAPMMIAFPLILIILVVVGGASYDNLLSSNVLGKVHGVHSFVEYTRSRAGEHLRQLVHSEQLPDMLADHMAQPSDKGRLDEFLSLRSQTAQLDFLVIADQRGRVIASSTGITPGSLLPETFVIRQARTGVPGLAYERWSEDELRLVSPLLAQRARIELLPRPADGEPEFETRGLLINAAVHFPLSQKYPNAILFGGVLLNRNLALVDHVREIVFSVHTESVEQAATTSLMLDDIRVATNVTLPDGRRALGTRVSSDVAKAVLQEGNTWGSRARVIDTWQIAGYEPLLDGEGVRIGMIYAGFPETPYIRQKWTVLGSVATILAVAMLALTLINIFVARRLSLRLYRIAEAMAAVRQGNRDVRLRLSNERDEIGQLAGHFDELIASLAEQEMMQRQSQVQIADEAARRHALFEHVRDGIVVLGDDGRIFEANHKFAEMLGYEPEELQKLSLRDWTVLFSEPLLHEQIESIGPEGALFQTVQVRKDGGTFDVEVSVSRIEWGGKIFLLCIQRDITERLRMSAELVQHRHHLEAMIADRTLELAAARDEAEHANRAKSVFLANMSHEIRTPMNAIVGFTHMLRRDKVTPPQAEKLGRIAGAAEHLLSVINDILDISKIEAGKVTLENIDLDLDNVLSQVSSIIALRTQAKGIELLLDVPHLPKNLSGDPTRLSQVLLNYLGNAVKFTERGSISLRGQVLEETASDFLIRFEVEDTGIGIPEERLGQLFSAFEQADVSTTRRYGGTGLGLVINKRIAELMHGEVGVRSKPGEGSCFWVTARLAKRDPARDDLSKDLLRGRRALIASDVLETQMALSQLLRQFELRVSSVLSGQDAIQIIRAADAGSDPIALTLIDLNLPDLDGVAIIGELQKPELNAPPFCLLMTAYGDPEISASAISAGFADVLVKPVSSALLKASLLAHFAAPAGETGQVAEIEENAEAILRSDFAGAKVLLTEDDPINQMIAQELLEDVGLVVSIANNGQEACEQLAANRYDLILMDMQMPVLDGLAATRQIRRLPNGCQVPVVAMTANAFVEDRAQCLDAGMDDFITKPVDPLLLYRILLQWLRKARQQR